MKRKSQRAKVLNHLQKGHGLTSLVAIKRWGITRLAAVIYILRKEGYRITTHIREKDGFAVYRLI